MSGYYGGYNIRWKMQEFLLNEAHTGSVNNGGKCSGKIDKFAAKLQVKYWHCSDLQFKFGQVRVLVKKMSMLAGAPILICNLLLQINILSLITGAQGPSFFQVNWTQTVRDTEIFKNQWPGPHWFNLGETFRVSLSVVWVDRDICCDIWIIANIPSDQPPSRESN